MLSQLHTLSGTELALLKNAVSAMQALSGGAPAVVTTPKEAKEEDATYMVLDVICEFMKAKGADFTSPTVLRKTKHYSAFRQKIMEDGMLDFYKKAAGNNRVALRALMRVGVKLLYQNLIELELPTNSRNMMAHMHRLPAVINRAFPGYAESGLLRMLIKRGD